MGSRSSSSSSRFLAVVCALLAVATSLRAQRVSAPHLHHDGFVLRIEKAARDAIGAPASGYDRTRFCPWRSDRAGPPRGTAIEERNRRLERYCDDRRVVYLSAVTEHFSVPAGARRLHVSVPLYREPAPIRRRYEDGYLALTKFARRLEERRRRGDYSHVVVLTMGWNVGRRRAVRQFDRLLDNLCVASAGAFRPLVVGVTWPSSWFVDSGSRVSRKSGHGPSYFSKLNDADELGSTLLSHALHHAIRPASGDLPVVLIGHSMGARILSRALHSAPFLRASPRGASPALFVGLQPAYSINRYIRGEGREGWPYAEFAECGTKIALTSTRNDKANRAARWLTGSRNAGGKYGLRTARRRPDVFEVLRWPDPATAEAPPAAAPVVGNRQRVLVLDVGTIVNGGEARKRAHSDVLDEEMATVLWWLLGGLKPS